MKKTTVLALILVCLMALGVVCVRPIKADPYPITPFPPTSIITINADGGITPSNATITQAGNTYTLIGDWDGNINVLRSNAVLNGNGQTVTGLLSISFTSNVTVENFNVQGMGYVGVGGFGIELDSTSNVTVVNNIVSGTGTGFYSELPEGGASAIDVEGGGSNVIVGNNLIDNFEGMFFHETENNLIMGNNITNSYDPYYPSLGIAGFGAGLGTVFWDASNNVVYHNNFVNNTVQAMSDSQSANVWDDGYPCGGNYWSDYQTTYPNATMIDSSGIGDTPYVIDSQNKDSYPLMELFNSTFFALQAAPPKLSVESPIDQTYSKSSVPLVFSVDVLSADKTVNWAGYSLDGEQNVTITGNTTITGLSIGLHNITVYANDTLGNMGASQTITFTIPQPFPTATVAAVSGAVAAVVVIAGLLVYVKKHKR